MMFSLLKIILFLTIYFIANLSFALPVKVIIDAGHGGVDFGTTTEFKGKKIKESTLALSLAKRIKEIAEQKYFNEIQINLSRHENNFLSLPSRLKNIEDTDIFLSLHYNSAYSADVFGTEIYFPEDYSFHLQSKINDDLSLILADLNETARIKKSIHFAERISKDWPLGLFKIRRAPFYLLQKSKTPTLLLEVGYLTHKSSLVTIIDNSHQDKVAEHILKNILINKSVTPN